MATGRPCESRSALHHLCSVSGRPPRPHQRLEYRRRRICTEAGGCAINEPIRKGVAGVGERPPDKRRSVYRRGQTSTKCNWLRTGKAEAALSHIGFAGCAGRASGARWSVSVTHRFLRRGIFWALADWGSTPPRDSLAGIWREAGGALRSTAVAGVVSAHAWYRGCGRGRRRLGRRSTGLEGGASV